MSRAQQTIYRAIAHITGVTMVKLRRYTVQDQRVLWPHERDFAVHLDEVRHRPNLPPPPNFLG
ncbi:hypothetical protein PDIDSM_3063 [Penicillium digitatum]|nr:hypothetical protein PDIDSM_3063 [Penicillium digitatum]